MILVATSPITLTDPDFGEQTAQACANACINTYPTKITRDF